jgi:branched-chain amino acid transport system ATP-binding protein
VLELSRVKAGYGKIQVLEGISMKFGESSITSILGANGAGKTTTLNCISGLVRVQQGEIVFSGMRIDRMEPDAIVAAGLCQVPEGREIFSDMTVRENLLMGAFTRSDRAEIQRDLDRVVDYFPVLGQRMTQISGTLSGGEQQMLLIARALMARPRLLMLDEPSLGLSPVLVEQIFEIIPRLRAEKLTIVLVEQNAAIALQISDYAYIMENGEIKFHAAAGELMEDPVVQKSYLGG